MPVVAMTSPVVVTAPIAAANVYGGRRDVIGVGLIDHGRRSEIDAQIDPCTCHGRRAKRENTENKTYRSLFHGQSLQ